MPAEARDLEVAQSASTVDNSEDVSVSQVSFKNQQEDDEEVPTAEAVEEANLPPQRLALVVMICMVQGYTLIGPLQHVFRVQMGVGDTGDVAHVFTQAAAFVQWGKFAMTLGQNVLFTCLDPLQRVYVAMVGQTVGTFIPPLFAFALGSKWLGWVFISYGCIGLSMGIFECTYLNFITPLGPMTKSWAIMGFPGAFFLINVFGMTIVSLGVPVEALFWYIVCGLPIGLAVFATHIVPLVRGVGNATAPAEHPGKHSTNKQALILNSLRNWHAWFPRLAPFMIANIVGHFVMEGALPANFNAFNDHEAPLLGRTDSHLMNKNQFFVVFFVFVGLGDMISRRVGYCFHLERYRYNMAALIAGILCSVFGMWLTTLGFGTAAWASAFFTFWGQGFNYAVASKYIDRFVPREHNLTAYSFWMFAGSAGAIAGSTTVDFLRLWICGHNEYPHLCLSGQHHHR